MAGLKAIKGKIRSVHKTRTVTKAMEAVSAAKMRKAQVAALSGRSYAKAAVSILGRLSGSGVLAKHPFALARTINAALYIVITSDKGLAGSLNSSVLKATLADIQKLGLPEKDVHIVAVGRKANEFFGKRGFAMDAYFPNIDGAANRELIEKAVAAGLMRYQMGAADTVRVAFQSFVSTFEQRAAVRTMLPLSIAEMSRIVGEIVPAKGKFAEVETLKAPVDYSIEPSPEGVLEALVPGLASVFIYHALLESQASEHSARMVAMKSASDKARDMAKELTLDFNKARQAGITREVSEIIGGIEAMTT